MTDAQDYADFQAWKASRDDAKAQEEASRISFADVIHRLIDVTSWNHEADRNAAHAAVAREYPSEESADTTDQSTPPPPPPVTPANSDQGTQPGFNG